MILGTVNARYEGVVHLRLRGPSGAESEVDTLVDSGFSGSLTLPKAVISCLELDRRSEGQVTLADGSSRKIEYFAAEVHWHDGWRTILVMDVGGDPLLGMRLMSDHELKILVRPGGSVEIVPATTP